MLQLFRVLVALIGAAAAVDGAAAPVAGRTLEAEHGVVCRLPGDRFGYFGWPTVARMDDGTLLVVSSGLRAEHVCPYGKTVLNVSRDDGRSWSPPRVIQDSPIDDRDAGIVNLGGTSLLASFFRSDTRIYAKEDWIPAAERESWPKVFADWTDEQVAGLVGSWTIVSDDSGATWSEPRRAPVSTPHGPIKLADGDLLYLGKPFATWKDMEVGQITAARSSDRGQTWRVVGRVPVAPRTTAANYHEPHVVGVRTPQPVLTGRIASAGGLYPSTGEATHGSGRGSEEARGMAAAAGKTPEERPDRGRVLQAGAGDGLTVEVLAKAG